MANLASGAAKELIADATAYGASKTALVRMTESLAHELEGCGVSVFAIDPGQVDPGMHSFSRARSNGCDAAERTSPYSRRSNAPQMLSSAWQPATATHVAGA
jgi:short-subunit dehydrogenase